MWVSVSTIFLVFGVSGFVTTFCGVSRWPAKRRVEVEEDSEEQFSETGDCESEAWSSDDGA